MYLKIVLTLFFSFNLLAQDEPPVIKDKDGKISIGKVQEDSVKIEVTKEKQISSSTNTKSTETSTPSTDTVTALTEPAQGKVTKEKQISSSTNTKSTEASTPSTDTVPVLTESDQGKVAPEEAKADTAKVVHEKEVAVSTLISNKTILQITPQEADQYFRKSSHKILDELNHFESVLDKDIDSNELSQSYQKLRDRIKVRNELINHISPQELSQLYDYGPASVEAVSIELHYLKLTQNYTSKKIRLQLSQLSNDISLYIFPLILSIFYLYCWVWTLKFCYIKLGKFFESFKDEKYMLAKPIWKATPWFIYELRRPLTSLIFAHLLLLILHKPFDSVGISPFRYFITTGFIGYLMVSIITAYNKRFSNSNNRRRSTEELRQKTIRTLGYLIVTFSILGGFLKFYDLSSGSLSSWLKNLYTILMITLIIRIIYWWKVRIHMNIISTDKGDNICIQWLRKNIKNSFKFPVLILALIYLAIVKIIRLIIDYSGKNDFLKLIVAYLFRLEIKRQSKLSNNLKGLTKIDDDDLPIFAENYRSRNIQKLVVEKQTDALLNLTKKEQGSISMLIGERGSGKTTLLNHIYFQNEKNSIQIDVSPRLTDTLKDLQNALDTSSLLSTYFELKKSNKTFILYNVNRLIKPCVGGLQQFNTLVRIMRNCRKAKWVMSSNHSTWQFLDKARGERFKFHNEIKLPRWTDEELAALIDKRNALMKLEPDFTGVKLPSQLDIQDIEEARRSLYQYTRIIGQYSGGNPGVALHLWKESLYKNEEDHVLVRLFETRNIDVLDAKPIIHLIILRTILQIEMAPINAIAASIQMEKDHLINILKALSHEEFILEKKPYHYQINWPWYRPIKNILIRKRLLN